MYWSAQGLVDRKRSEVEWILPGLLKRGNTGFIIGPPKKACKSWLMLALAWDLSEGMPVWNIMSSIKGDGAISIKPTFKQEKLLRTVYLTQEDTEDDIQDRVLAHVLAGRRPNERLWFIPKNLSIALDTPTGRAILEKELDGVVDKGGPIDLVMLDPMRRLHGGDENDSQSIARLWGVLELIHKRYNCATLISHHTVKPPRGGDFVVDMSDPFVARGSGDIYGGGDAFIVVVPKELESDAGPLNAGRRKLALHFESKRGRPLPPAMLRMSFGTGGVEYLGQAWEEHKEEKKDDKATSRL